MWQAAASVPEPAKAALDRQSACRKWIFSWDSEELELVPDEEGGEGGVQAQRRLREDPGFTEQEVEEAVSAALKSEDLEVREVPERDFLQNV
jgi:hypothetical protein